MKVAILGAGKQARGAVHYLLDKNIKKISIFDKDEFAAVGLYEDYRNLRSEVAPNLELTGSSLDASNLELLAKHLRHYDLVFNALPYSLSLIVTEAVITAGCNMVDLGGNSRIVNQQLKMSDRAKHAGVTIIPDCGIAPGLVSVLVTHAINQIEQVETIKVYVGGLPARREDGGPLEYGDFFSTEGLINEYTQPAKVLRNGAIKDIEPLSELERVSFTGGPFNWLELEAFSTSGGISTLPESFQNEVINLEYKTLRYPGHWRALQLLKQVDAFNAETFRKLLKPIPDMILLRMDANGFTKEGAKVERTYTMCVRGYLTGNKWDSDNPAAKLTAMMKATAYPAAAVLLALKNAPAGIYRQEEIIEPSEILAKLKKAGLCVEICEKIEYDPK